MGDLSPSEAAPTSALEVLLNFWACEEEGLQLDGESIADWLWLAVNQPALAMAKRRRTPQTLQTGRKPGQDLGVPRPEEQAKGDSSSQDPALTLAPSPLSSTMEPATSECPLEAQLLPKASLPGVERLPVWVRDPLPFPDPQRLFEAVLPVMQDVPGECLSTLDERATLDRYLRERQLRPVWQPEWRYRFELIVLLDQGFSMLVWQPFLANLTERLRGFHGFQGIRLVPWETLPAQSTAAEAGKSFAAQAALAAAPGGSDRLVVVVSDCAGSNWWGEEGFGGGPAFRQLSELASQLPVVIWQVLPDWMWPRTALGQREAATLRRSLEGSAWPFQLAMPNELRRPGEGEGGKPLPVFGLSLEGLRAWGIFFGGSPFAVARGILLPRSESATMAVDSERQAREASPEGDGRDGSDQLMPLRRFQHLASEDARRLMGLFAAAPVLTLPVMRLIQAALLESTGTSALAEVVLSGLLRPVAADDLSDPQALQLSFTAPMRAALLKQQSPDTTLKVIEAVTDFIAVHWSQQGWGSFRAFLMDPTIAAPIQQKSSQHFATLAADILAELGGDYLSFAERLRFAQRKERWPRNLFPFQEVEFEAAHLARMPEPMLVAFTTAGTHDVKSQKFTFKSATLQGGSTTSVQGIARGYREPLALELVERREGQPVAQEAPPEISLEMLHIPPGSYQMGSPPNEPKRYDDEGPQHEVRLETFFLSRTPITQAQWRAVALWEPGPDEDPWPVALDPDPVAKLDDPKSFQGDQRPVVNVSWHEAMAFCHRLRVRTGKHYTLPSEAQWEYACRARTTTPFHFGDTLTTELANYDGRSSYGQSGTEAPEVVLGEDVPGEVISEAAELAEAKQAEGELAEESLLEGVPRDGASPEPPSDSAPATGLGMGTNEQSKFRGQTTEVALFPANAWGLHDMHGNVWEWCADHWHDNYEGAPADGRPWVQEKAEEESRRLLRGGSWFHDPGCCRSAYRGRGRPGYRDGYVGFRVCCLPQDLILYT